MATSAITPTPRTPAQLRAEAARAVNLGALLAFPLFVLLVFALPSSGAALVALAALALGFLAFLGGAVYVTRMSGLRPDHGPDHGPADHTALEDSPAAQTEGGR